MLYEQKVFEAIVVIAVENYENQLNVVFE